MSPTVKIPRIVLTAILLGVGMACLSVGGAREIIDMTGGKIVVPEHPGRVLSLCSAATDAIVRLGAADRLAAIDDYGRIVPGTDNARIIGKAAALSREQLAVLNCDIAFIWWYQDDAANVLTKLGVPVVRIRSGRANQVPTMIELMGCSIDIEPVAHRLAEECRKALAGADRKPAAHCPRVYLELYGPFKTAGSDSYINDLIEMAGGSNVAANATGSVLLSAEELVQADPDVILFVEGFAKPETFTQRPGVASLTAVRTGRIAAINPYWLVEGAGLPQSIEQLRETIQTSAKSGAKKN